MVLETICFASPRLASSQAARTAVNNFGKRRRGVTALTFADRNEICDATNRSVTLLCFDTSLRHYVYAGKFGKTPFVSQFTSIYRWGSAPAFANLRGNVGDVNTTTLPEICVSIVELLRKVPTCTVLCA